MAARGLQPLCQFALNYMTRLLGENVLNQNWWQCGRLPRL